MSKSLNFWPHHDLLIVTLGICPLLVVVTNTTTGIATGLLCSLTLITTGVAIALLKNLIPYELRLFIILIVTSTLVSLVNLGMQLWFYPLSLELGIYVPLIAMNCLIIVYAEEVYSRETAIYSFLHSLRISTGIILIFIMIGAVREVLGSGTLLQQAGLLFGESAQSWQIELFDGKPMLILFKLAPGAFIIMGFMLAIINYTQTQATSHEPPVTQNIE